MNTHYDYAFIGAGNMAKALIAGLIKPTNNQQGKLQIIASTQSTQSAQKVKEQFAISTTTHNSDCLNAKTLVLCVKPQQLKSVIEILIAENGPNCLANKLIITVIAGVPLQAYEQLLGGSTAIIRSMPNTPALLGQGVTGLYAHELISADQRQIAEQLFAGVGQFLWVATESGIDDVNATSGSGPAYYYAFTRAFAKTGIALGLSETQALLLATQTAKGAAAMCESATSIADLDTLIAQVSSKGGTTLEALASFENDQLDAIMERAVLACHRRAIELGEQFTQNILTIHPTTNTTTH